MPHAQEERFDCPQCGARYTLVRVEALPQANEKQVECLKCGAPFHARDGKFVLKYFLVGPKTGRGDRR
ncbi:MAG TPA: MJ0042-type zinc finger domain-containing protein, partial [Xanthobacteraceae bacterium]|nr:MJ0042-type zinc finger domain-containing protein [Xanthobacteraceae bacterium]